MGHITINELSDELKDTINNSGLISYEDFGGNIEDIEADLYSKILELEARVNAIAGSLSEGVDIVNDIINNL